MNVDDVRSLCGIEVGCVDEKLHVWLALSGFDEKWVQDELRIGMAGGGAGRMSRTVLMTC